MILCLDLETSGLDERRCGLFEIGAVWLHGGAFFRACRPFSGAEIEAPALAVNGRSESDATDPARLREAIAVVEFLGWARGAMGTHHHLQIAAWNAHFDHRHLMAALTRAGVEHGARPFVHRLIDLHSLVAGEEMRRRFAVRPHEVAELENFGGEIRNADEGSRRLDLTPEAKPHDALAGARQVRAMLRRFLGDAAALP